MVFLVKLADRYIGKILCGLLSMFKGSSKDFGSGNILIIQLWGIGETVLTLPAIDTLRKKFPKSAIDVLATSRNKGVYKKNESIDRVKLVSMNPFSVMLFMLRNFRKYDLVIDMEEYLNVSAIMAFFAGKKRIGYSHGTRAGLYHIKIDYNDKQHASKTYLDLVKELMVDYKFDKLLKLNYSKSDKKTVDALFKASGIKAKDHVVCVAPGAAESAKARMWPLDRYAQVCDEIIEKHKSKIVFTGTLEEFELIEGLRDKMEHKDKAYNLAGRISINRHFVTR